MSISFKYLDHQAADLIIIRKNVSTAAIINIHNMKYLDYQNNVLEEDSMSQAGPSSSNSSIY